MADGSIIIDTKLDNTGLKSELSKISGIAKTALKGVTVVAGTVATVFAGIVTASVNARGEIEQQIGGVETLFKNSADKVIKNAENAYKTAGMSASDYMQTVTSFSASLLQSLGGDTAKAADVADMALTDMSDNANKFGTSMEAIQNAYQGFAKQNYTMLDNLKLGYGGTKTEMERLLKDAQKLTGVKYNINNLSDVYNAIHAIQEELGVTGTTAKEASSTLQGSIASLKASWSNFLSGSGDITQVIDSAKIALENIVRLTKEALTSITSQLGELLQEKLEPIKKWIEEHQTQIIAVTGVIATLTAAILAYNIAQNATAIVLGIVSTATSIATAVTSAFGAVMAFITSPITLVVLAIGALITIVVLLVKNWDTVKEKTLEIWNKLKDFLSETIDKIIEWFKNLPYEIGNAIGKMIGHIIKFGQDVKEWITTKLPEIINNIIDWFKKLPSNIWQWLVNTINNIGQWLQNMKNKIAQDIPQIINSIVNFFKELPNKMLDIGKNIIEGLWNGIKNATSWIKNKVKEFAKGILDGMKSALGIHSPSRLFRDEVGKYIALGVGEGFDKNIDSVYKQMKTAIDFETQKLSTNLSASANVNRMFTANISVNGDTYLDNEKVGRMIAPTVTKTLRTGGAY